MQLQQTCPTCVGLSDMSDTRVPKNVRQVKDSLRNVRHTKGSLIIRDLCSYQYIYITYVIFIIDARLGCRTGKGGCGCPTLRHVRHVSDIVRQLS